MRPEVWPGARRCLRGSSLQTANYLELHQNLHAQLKDSFDPAQK